MQAYWTPEKWKLQRLLFVGPYAYTYNEILRTLDVVISEKEL